jgi:hypothetical protein
LGDFSTSGYETAIAALVGWIEDQAEHYGKLVSNYRAVGIVPPSSRQPAPQ